MKKTILLFFILITGVNYHASAQQFKTALDYHNYVAREQENVVNAVIYFTNHFNSKDSVLLDNYSKTKDILKKSWEHIQKMPSYEGDSELLNAAIPLFEMYYSTMNIEYHEMVDLFIKKDFSKKTQDRVNSLLNSINEKEKKLDYHMVQAQTNFAKKYHLDIQKNPIQQKVNELKK